MREDYGDQGDGRNVTRVARKSTSGGVLAFYNPEKVVLCNDLVSVIHLALSHNDKCVVILFHLEIIPAFDRLSHTTGVALAVV